MKQRLEPAQPGGWEQMRSKAYSHIQRKIVTGELAPGQAVSELAVSKDLGSSRTPVREAIGQLVAEGFLDQTPKRGVVVMRLTRHDIVELFELREALELYAVGKAAQGPIRDAELERLRGLSQEFLDLKAELERSKNLELDAAQMQRLMMADLGFHTTLMRMAGNTRMLKVLNETRLLIRIFAMHHRGHRADEVEQIRRQHGEVVDAVVDRQPERAMKLLSDHIMTSRRERLDEFDHWEYENSLRQTIPDFIAPVLVSGAGPGGETD